MRDCLLIMHAREIPSCVESLRKLKIPKIWFRGFNMKQLETEIPRAIRETDFDNYIIISDDTTPEQQALDYVRNTLEAHEAAAGFSNMNPNSKNVNVSLSPLRGSFPGAASVTYAMLDQVLKQETLFRVYFAGFSFVGLRRYLWERFPYRSYQWAGGPAGRMVGQTGLWYWGSDYNECWRLQKARIPITCHRLAFVYHLASVENFIVGKVEPTVIKEL